MGQLLKKIEDEVSRSNEKRFVKHYFEKHDEPYLPPSWSISECVTFGLWSRTYSILRDPIDKKGIAKKFGVDKSEVFESWIHALTVARNIAAHHGQLLKTKIQVAPANYKSMNIKFSDQKSFFAIATVVNYLLSQTGLPHNWKSEIESIFIKYPNVSLAELGFPVNWKSLPGW
ncbi:Abi family protein [Xanthomonas perforans]|nr:Abi family protein [Xanthomonas perforans]